jgi:hypothetical protein
VARDERVQARYRRAGHLEVEVVAFACSLTDASEHREAATLNRDVADELHDEHGLADTGAAEQTDLATTRVGREQVDDLDAGLEGLELGVLLGEGRGRAVDRHVLLGAHRTYFVHRLADDVQDATQDLGPDRHGDGSAGVTNTHAARQALGGVHSDRAHRVFA